MMSQYLNKQIILP